MLDPGCLRREGPGPRSILGRSTPSGHEGHADRRSGAASAARSRSISSRSRSLLSRKAGRPVKMTMTREEVFRGDGADLGLAHARQDRREVATARSSRRTCRARFRGGLLSPARRSVRPAMTVFTPYEVIPNFKIIGVRRRAEQAQGRGLPRARRADRGLRRSRACSTSSRSRSSGSTQSTCACKNAVEEGDRRRSTARSSARSASRKCSRPPSRAPATTRPVPSAQNQGRGVAAGFWFNAGMQSSATVSVNDDGTAVVIERATRTSAAPARAWRSCARRSWASTRRGSACMVG